MPPIAHSIVTSLVAFSLQACGGGGDDKPLDAASQDAALDASGGGCSVAEIPAFQQLPANALLTRQIMPSITAQGNEVIHDVLQQQTKRHYLVAPIDGRPLRNELFVWLGGSGTDPDNYKDLLELAALAGYASIALAYDNETSIGSLCSSPSNPQCNDVTTPNCEGVLRAEMIYGSAVSDSPCHDVPLADSIEHRLLRLLQHLATAAPETRAAMFLTANKQAIEWSRIVIGGWSQGGGHAGMIARDHAVARALYVSKGAGSTPCSVSHTPAECDLDGDGVITAGNVDELLIPTAWANEPRMTPPGRQFGIIHRSEDAWNYSREVFEKWGMGAKSAVKPVDGIGSDYAQLACSHVLSTGHVPPPPCMPDEFHSSMAADLCVPLATMAPAYLYMLTLPTP